MGTVSMTIILAVIGLLIGALLNIIADHFLQSTVRQAKGISLFCSLRSLLAPYYSGQTNKVRMPLRYPLGELTLALLIPLTIQWVGWEWEI
ncbi:MAG: hypothetical protein K6T85_09495, partial [Gorillibacterium sp.]|nr:hypothetical protein [Gorillibacterium sp.]